MKSISITLAGTLACASTVALAQPADPARRNGDHPAIVVQRLAAQAGYDYASRFYPHPAWLYLLPEAPRPLSDHPAVVVWRAHEAQQREWLAREAAPQLASRDER